jgi:hypothetical protein
MVYNRMFYNQLTLNSTLLVGTLLVAAGLIMGGCQNDLVGPSADEAVGSETTAFSLASSSLANPSNPGGGATTANGWYEEEEIYYILHGVEDGVTERGENDLYLIGGDRAYQANVAEFIPGEPGYSPHWNVHVVHTAAGVNLAAILTSPYVSSHYPEALFDDVADILAARDAGLVTIDTPGVVVLCPIISEEGAEAPGNTELSEDFAAFPETF